MHERRFALATLACVAWLATSVAQAEVVKLATLEQVALEKHALLQAGALRERAAAAEIREAESAYMPRIGMNVGANAAPGRVLRRLPTADGDLFVSATPALKKSSLGEALTPQPRAEVSVELGANLYDFGRTQAAVAAGRARHRATKADQALTRAQVIESVRALYLTWLSAHELHRIAATASDDAARRGERVAALIAEGARPRTDLPPVDAERLLTELERERAEGNLESARRSLEQSVGEELPADAEPDLALLQPSAAPADGADVPDPALRSLAHQREALLAAARLQRKQRAPLLSTSLAVGAYGQMTSRPSDRDGEKEVKKFMPFPLYAVGLSLTVPLWDGGESAAAAEAAEARAAELGVHLASSEREQQHEIERARRDQEHAAKRQALAEQLLAVSRKRFEDVEAGYQLGVMQFEHVQSARELMRRAETELVLAKVAGAEAALRVNAQAR